MFRTSLARDKQSAANFFQNPIRHDPNWPQRMIFRHATLFRPDVRTIKESCLKRLILFGEAWRK
jgi:hypothetical protein